MKVETLPSGHKRVRVYYYVDGKRKCKSITAPTAQECKKLALEFETSVKDRGLSKSLKDACISYISVRSSILSPSTIIGYKKTINNEFKPLMHVDCNLITNKDIQVCINEMSRRVSLKTIKNHYSFIHSVLVENTGKTYKVDFPKPKKKDIYIPNDADIEHLLSLCRGEEMEIIIMLGAFLGLRRGEIVALKNNDFDISKQSININKAVVFDGKKQVVKQPKTFTSYRTLDVPERLWELIQGKIDRKEKVITLSLSSITHRFTRLVDKLDCPHFSFHKLRHYFASNLVALGVADIYAMQMTGHSTQSLLKAVYQHTMSKEEQRVRELVKNNLGNKKED